MCDIVLEETSRIPSWVVDHDSYRRWAYSNEFPEQGRYAFFNGSVWVDLSIEQDTHNHIKTEVMTVVAAIVRQRKLGRVYSDRMLLTNKRVGLSTEPDGMFVAWSTFESDRVRLEGGPKPDGVELVGAPDMVLEVVSPKSVTKDTIRLPVLYRRAGIAEYWLIDNRGADLRFDILRLDKRTYRATRSQAGWRHSKVFDMAFQLRRDTNQLGQQAFVLESK